MLVLIVGHDIKLTCLLRYFIKCVFILFVCFFIYIGLCIFLSPTNEHVIIFLQINNYRVHLYYFKSTAYTYCLGHIYNTKSLARQDC